MTHVVQLALLAIVVAATSVAARGATYQTIRVSVLSVDEVKVEGKRLSTSTLIATISNLVQDNNRVEIRLYVRIGARKTIITRFMQLCREAGASSFTVIPKA